MRDILPSSQARPSAVSRTTAAVAAAATALAAWLSQATLAFTGAGDARVAIFPISVTSFLIVIAAAALVWLAWRAGASLAPLWLLVLIALPWISASGFPAFLIWSGPMAVAVWAAVGVAMLVSVRLKRDMTGTATVASAFVRTRSELAAGALACLIYSVAAWQVAPSIPGGDEPHYLIITQSLLKDHDLRIANNHREGDYRSYFAGELSKPDFRRYGRNGEIYSIHAPGLPMLIAPAFALGGYHAVMVFLILLASAGSGLAWHLAWNVTRRREAAWFGWSAVTVSTSAIFHSFTVYPDGPGGVIALTGVWALLRATRESETGSERVAPWWLHGAALAALPWIHTRFVLLAAGFGALILLRLSTTRNAAAKAVAFLMIPAVSALGWIGYFVAIYGTPDPAAPYANEEGAVALIPGGLAGLFFDQRFGVLVYSPVLICALAGLARMVRERSTRRLGLELLFVMIPYLLAVTHFAMWWGGTSAPGRFFVPVLSLLAIPCGVAWGMITHRATRATACAALAFTAVASAALIFVDDGRLAYNVRQAYAAWPEWLNDATHLPLGLPSWWHGQEIARMLLVRDAGVWIAAVGAAWLILRSIENGRWLRDRGALVAATAAMYAAAVMAALTIVWTLAGTEVVNRTASQFGLLRRLSLEPRVLAVSVPGLRTIAPSLIPPMLRIEPRPSSAPGGAGPNDRPLYQVPLVPAGQYRLRVHAPGASGWLMVGIGRDQFSLQSGPLSATPEPVTLTFPVDVRAIVVRGDEQARRAIRTLTIEPISIVPPDRRLTSEYARRAVRYGTSSVYFLDDRSFPEPEAFWIGGSRRSSVVLQPDNPAAPVALLVRNAPVENGVVMESGNWREDLHLAAGEERRVTLPIDQGRGAALVTVTTTSGFRPSVVDPKSRDNRFLGVWIRVIGD